MSNELVRDYDVAVYSSLVLTGFASRCVQ